MSTFTATRSSALRCVARSQASALAAFLSSRIPAHLPSVQAAYRPTSRCSSRFSSPVVGKQQIGRAGQSASRGGVGSYAHYEYLERPCPLAVGVVRPSKASHRRTPMPSRTGYSARLSLA